jgi:hypothetical protein
MTQTASDTDTLQAFRNRNKLIRTVRAKLKGSGLEIRELANALVISHPGHPEYGRIHITYAHGEVSHRRTIWDYLGCLDGNASTGADDEPGVDIDMIVNMLTGRTGIPS